MDEKQLKSLRDDMQKLVGSSPKVQVTTFKNWAGNMKIKCLEVRPTKVPEAQAVIRAARSLDVSVRAAGTGHSWSPIFSDEGQVVMRVRDLQRPDGQRIELDQSVNLVTMATGVTTGELMEFELNHRVNLPCNTILRVVQMGGVVSPACHGVGWDARTVSDYIVRMRILDSNGDLKVYDDSDPEMLKAIKCNLGLWGIIVDFTLKVEPEILVETQNIWMKAEEVFFTEGALKKIVHDNWSVEIFWFTFSGISRGEAVEAWMTGDVDCGEWDPKLDDIWLRLINKPDTVGEVKGPDYYKDRDFRTFMKIVGFDMIDQFLAKFTKFAPSFARTQVSTLKKELKSKLYQQLTHAVHFRTNIEDVEVHNMEWAFSLDPDCANVCKATRDLVELIRQDAMKGKFPINLPIEMRFMADSEAYMAPAIAGNPDHGGSGHTCYLDVVTINGTKDWEDYAKRASKIFQGLRSARPHWCKEWDYVPGIDNYIRKAYSDQIPKYLKALERSGVDPTGMFFNGRLETILYPKGHPGRRQKKNPAKKADDKNDKKSRTCTVI